MCIAEALVWTLHFVTDKIGSIIPDVDVPKVGWEFPVREWLK